MPQNATYISSADLASPRKTGRWLGFGLLLSLGLGVYSNFQLQNAFMAPPGFLQRAAGMPAQIGTAVLIGLFTAMISLGIAVALRGLYGLQQPWLSRFYLALVAAGLATSLIEGSLFVAMGELSTTFLATGTDPSAYEPVRALLRGLRNGIHYPDKLLGGICVTLMFALLLRARALPRWMAMAGIAASACQCIAVTRELFGHNTIYALLAPLALLFLCTGLWLLFKGLPVPNSDAAAEHAPS